MSNYGIKVSLEGFDVGTADLNGLNLHTGYPVVKIAGSGTGSFSHVHGSSGTATLFTHNLGYKPLVFIRSDIYSAFLEDVVPYAKVPIVDISGGALLYHSYTYEVGTADVKMYHSTSPAIASGTTTLNYYYFYYHDEDASLGNL